MLHLPLRFHASNGPSQHGIKRTARRGRRLGSAVISERLSGDLMSRGYFAAEIMVGTPPQRFSLIVDTGSSITALPCAECSSCGEHANPRFRPAASRTFEPVGCGERDFGCTSCQGGACAYHVVYQEGSSYSGYLATDVVHLGAGGACAALRIAFGCATTESGHFRFQQADGIMGLASSRHLSSLEAAAEMSGGSGRGRPPRQGALASATDAESDGDGRSLLRLLSGGGHAEGGLHGIAMASSSTRKATAAASSTGEPSQQHRGVHSSTGEPDAAHSSVSSQQIRGVHSSTDAALDSSVDQMLTAARSPTVLEALVAQGLVADGFSLCIGRGTGHLSFGLPRAWQAVRRGAGGTADGGTLRNGSSSPLNGRTALGSQHDASPRPLVPPPSARLEPTWARAESGAYYSVGVRGLRYGDRPIGTRPTSTIIDSGTTFMYVPSAVDCL